MSQNGVKLALNSRFISAAMSSNVPFIALASVDFLQGGEVVIIDGESTSQMGRHHSIKSLSLSRGSDLLIPPPPLLQAKQRNKSDTTK